MVSKIYVIIKKDQKLVKHKGCLNLQKRPCIEQLIRINIQYADYYRTLFCRLSYINNKRTTIPQS